LKDFYFTPDSKCAQQDRGNENKNREHGQDIELQGKVHDHAPPSQLKPHYSRTRSSSEGRNMLQRELDRVSSDPRVPTGWDRSGFPEAAY
jgi:hypothetical protein